MVGARPATALSVAAFAGDGANMERDYDYAGTRWLSDLPAAGAIGAKAAARVLARLGATQMSSGAMPVMFDPPRSLAHYYRHLSAPLAAPAIARGGLVSKRRHGYASVLAAP